ncbi:polyprenyl synthetase family protein [Saccharopolyspora pogona]|uniref:polyprenyl synthetase family protein n=1 Tax=Saccharopolyspora pogona TaxID=333966 RepID=UPI00168542AA|nr:polyprenyl synthetase family protein [Saccharopolyspora pogona]
MVRFLPGVTIDPVVDDLPHLDCGMEWWYFHTHLTTEHGDDVGLVLVFTRHLATRAEGEPLRAHFAMIGRTDHTAGRHTSAVWVDRGWIDTVRTTITNDAVMDPVVRQALVELFDDGTPVAPDLLMGGEVMIAEQELDLRYGDVATLRKLADGSYHVTFDDETQSCDLVFTPVKPPIIQHDDVFQVRFQGPESQAFSYFAPRMAVQGRIGNATVSGSGWYEHTFGAEYLRPDGDQRYPDGTWNWTGIQLDNGWDISAATIDHIDVNSRRSVFTQRFATAYSPDCERVSCDVELVGDRRWTSLSSLNTYPTRWTLSAPALELDVVVEAELPQQEILTMVTHGSYLEACANVRGTMRGEPVSGRAFIEVMPANRVARIEEFLGRLRDVTHDEVRKLYPDSPSEALTVALAAREASGAPHAVVYDAMVRPLRYVSDTSGRGWRSFVTCAALELFGVRAEQYRQLLAVTELIHSGYLMVDDVEDDSPMRRGEPTAHLVFGAPTAINAGTASYFVLDRVLAEILPDERRRLRAYESYLRAMRGAHVGQGIDITGHHDAMNLAVASGDPTALLAGLRWAQRLKTGAYSRTLAEIGALTAGASDEQITAMGNYFEAVGLAYQITDDVMDLDGVTNRLPSGEVRATKHIGEDLRAGKVTMPLAQAVGRLPHDRMAAIWTAVRDGNADDVTVREVAAALVECGAVQACYDDAKAQVDAAWAPLDSLLPKSFAKAMVRALGFYASLREHEPAVGDHEAAAGEHEPAAGEHVNSGQ